MRAIVSVTLKQDVLDPQGKAIQRACAALGHEKVSEVRQGKFFELMLSAADQESALRLVQEIASSLLSNPVIEDFKIERIDPA